MIKADNANLIMEEEEHLEMSDDEHYLEEADLRKLKEPKLLID